MCTFACMCYIHVCTYDGYNIIFITFTCMTLLVVADAVLVVVVGCADIEK